MSIRDPASHFRQVVFVNMYIRPLLCNIMFTSLSVSPASGVWDEMLAAGPGSAFILALTLKVYKVKGFRLAISAKVASAPSIKTYLVEPETGSTTCTVYPVMKLFCSFGIGVQETSADVGSL